MTQGRTPFRAGYRRKQRESLLGTILIGRSLSLEALSLFVLGLAACVVVFLVLASHARRIVVPGEVSPESGLILVRAPVSGVVEQVGEEGAVIGRGDGVAVINVPWKTRRGDEVDESTIDRLAVRLESVGEAAAQKRSSLEIQLGGSLREAMRLERERSGIEREVAHRREQVELTEATLLRLSGLADSKYVSEIQVNQQRDLLLERRASVSALERALLSLDGRIDAARQEISLLEARERLVDAELLDARAELEQTMVDRDISGGLSIPSPVAGTLAAVDVGVGQQVQAGDPIATIVPEGVPLVAVLYLPSHALGSARTGAKVSVRYAAYPHQQFGQFHGVIKRISSSPVTRRQPQGAQDAANAPVFRVVVELERQSITKGGRTFQIIPGMLLEADIITDRRRLISWIFAPFQSLADK